MSSISLNAPTLLASADSMKDFLSFVYTHESMLKKYGAIKIIPPNGFKINLKKYRMKLDKPSTIQQVTKLNQQDLIYSVTTVPCMYRKESNEESPMNEQNFWSSLSQRDTPQQLAGVSNIPRQSFFLKEVHRIDFSIHRLPRQSLLRFCDKSLLHEFVPSLNRTHGPGGIFPLASARQRLFTFNYHHAGGDRYWYIIPASEREALERIFQQQTNSICIDHGYLLIDPTILDKYNIRYHRLIQKPYEIVILAAGALSQSFTDDASWSETIDFALPSWINDGHSAAKLSCSCQSNLAFFPTIINTNEFNPVLIQRYIRTCLSIIVDDTSPPNTNKQEMETDKMPIFSDISLPSIDQLPGQILKSSTDNTSFHNSKIESIDHQTLLDIPIDDTLLKESYESPYSTISEHFPLSFEANNQLLSPEDLYDSTIALNKDKPPLLSYREILNIISSPPSTSRSIESQTEEPIDDQQDISIYSSITCKSNEIKHTENRNYDKYKYRKNQNKTLLISGMKNGVTKKDILNHFIGCKKITIKQSKIPPYLNYAFVLHRQSQQAEYNRRRSINHLIFGDNCRVEYSNKNNDHFIDKKHSDKSKIVVRQIPENVSEEHLRNLFSGCHALLYFPARVINKAKPENSASINKNRVLLGFAFVYYATSIEAAYVVCNPDKFQINNHPLHISFFTPMKSLSKTRQQMNDVRQSVEQLPHPSLIY